jgi:hypothetical protein
LFEEIGVLIASPAASSSSPGFPDGERRLELRADVLGGSLSSPPCWRGTVSRWMEACCLPLDLAALHSARLRHGFLPRALGGEEPRVVPGELASGEWIEPAGR